MEILGIHREKDIIGKKISTKVLIAPEDEKALISQFTQANYLERFELCVQSELYGEKILELNAHWLYSGRTPVSIEVTFRDITDREMLKKEKKEVEKHLQRSQKMEAIGTLSGGIAHDFNNILGAIMGYTELAKTLIPEHTKPASHLDNVMKASHRATDLVSQILTFSRQSNIEYSHIEPVPIIKESIKMLHSSIPASVEILEDIVDCHLTVSGNPTQIQQVVLNITTNAYHALENQTGKIKITCKPTYLDSKNDFLPKQEAGEYILIEVKDSGCGIAPEIMENMFDPYYTTKEAGKGTGLGLSIVKGIVEEMGGALRINSAVGKGSTFSIVFPCSDKSIDVKTANNNNKVAGGNEHILIVDDEESVIDIAEEALIKVGYQVTTTGSSKEALRLFGSSPDSFDLIITDQTMPEMMGMQLIQRLREIKPDYRVILSTGYKHSFKHEEFDKLDMAEILYKPYSPKELCIAVRAFLDRKTQLF